MKKCFTLQRISLLALLLSVGFSFCFLSTKTSAVSNEIGTFKETVFVDVLRNSGNTENIIDAQSGNWGRINSNFKYGLRINLRRSAGGNAYPFETGDIIDLSYVLVNTSYITGSGNSPSQPTCLNSSWIFTVVDCTIHMQNISDVEYLTTMYSVDLTMLRDPVSDSSSLGGLITQWSAGQPQAYSNNINIYYFQYRLRYTGEGESRDNIILYGNFTNGQPWWLQFNETIPISTSLEGASSIVYNQQQTTNAVNQQTEQQKNQYEQDKQEEQNREQQGNADSEAAQGLFSFTAFNPFSGIFALFTGGDGCVSIPTLASWLHSPTSSYCSWWPSSVRSVMTPVIGISAMMLLFGFFIRWLNGGSKPFETKGVNNG